MIPMDYTEIKSAIDGVSTSFEAYKTEVATDLKCLRDQVAEMKMNAQPVEYGTTVSDGMKKMIGYLRKSDTYTPPSTVGQNGNAGYLSVPEFVHNVHQKMYESAPMLDIVNRITINGNVAYVPVEIQAPSASFVDEVDEADDVGPHLNACNIQLKDLRVDVPISNVLLRDSNLVNLEQYMTNTVADAFARKISKSLISTETDGPGAIIGGTDPAGNSIGLVASGNASAITTDAIFDAMAKLNSNQLRNAKWVMSSGTFYAIAKAFGSDSNYVQMALGAGIPNSILGKEVVFAEAPSVAANAVPVLLGDFKQAVTTVTAGGISFLRDEYSRAKENITVMHAWESVGSAVVDASAVTGIKIATSL